MATFGEAVASVRLDVPAADALQVRTWGQRVYNALCDDYPWHFLRRETILTTLASADRTVGVTGGSPTVTGAGFVAADATRQFRVGVGLPWYTINSVNVGVDATLDQNYTGTTDLAASATIFDGYVRMPADFGAFEAVWDPTNQRPIVYGVPATDMMAMDPDRQQSDTSPRALVDSLVVQSADRVRYEWWPAVTAVGEFPMLYLSRPQVLTNTSELVGVLGQRPDVLVEGMLWRAALWPGTEEHRNPYFNLGLARAHQTEFERKKQKLSLRDDDQALQSYSDFDWAAWRRGGLSQTAERLRSSDADIGDFI